MVLPSITPEDIVVFIDKNEHGIDTNDDLLNKMPYRDVQKFPYAWRRARMDIGDILICVRRKKSDLLAAVDTSTPLGETEREKQLQERVRQLEDQLLALTDDTPPTEKQSGNMGPADDEEVEEAPTSSSSSPDYWVYDPVREYVSYERSADEIAGEADYIYVPHIVIERKKDNDLSSSIRGKKNDPDVLRYKDQKNRLHGFDAQTGAACGVLIEEYIKNCMKPMIGCLPEDSFNSALVNTAFADKFVVFHTVCLDDTVRSIDKIARSIVEKQSTNVVFPHIYAHVAAGIAAGTIRRREIDPNGYADDVRDKILGKLHWSRKLYHGIVPVEEMKKDYATTIAIRKKDNRDPKMCWLMQLQSFQTVKEKSRFIAAKYSNMHDFVHAYDAAPSEQARERLLEDIETDTMTTGKNPKKRKLGRALSAYVYHTSKGRRVKIEKGKAIFLDEEEV